MGSGSRFTKSNFARTGVIPRSAICIFPPKNLVAFHHCHATPGQLSCCLLSLPVSGIDGELRQGYMGSFQLTAPSVGGLSWAGYTSPHMSLFLDFAGL
jgi:hypothetical protein